MHCFKAKNLLLLNTGVVHNLSCNNNGMSVVVPGIKLNLHSRENEEWKYMGRGIGS